jgi:hypothetical protein
VTAGREKRGITKAFNWKTMIGAAVHALLIFGPKGALGVGGGGPGAMANAAAQLEMQQRPIYGGRPLLQVLV